MQRTVGLMSYLSPRPERAHFLDYLSLLRTAARSPELKRCVYVVPEMHASWSELEQIARAFAEIRAAGKTLHAYTEGGNLKTLYLVACADTREAAPHANFTVQLPGSDGYFLKNAIARLGVKVETFHAGKFKAEGYEMFTRTGYSPAAKRNLKELLGDLRAGILAHFAKTLPEDTAAGFARLIQRQVLARAAELRQVGFFDGVLSPSMFDERLSGLPAIELPPHAFARNANESTGADGDLPQTAETSELPAPGSADQSAKPPRIINEAQLFARDRRRRMPLFRLRSLPTLALVSMEGAIQQGQPDEPPKAGSIQALAMREIIRDLAESRAEAVLLYINSPGGGADASELLHESIARLARYKPVLALLGPIAASGGYYLACAANRIYASPLSILGSIGVISLRPDLAGLYQKLGVRREVVLRDPTDELFAEAGKISPAGKKLMESSLQQTYELFLQRVAEGRDRSRAEVLQHAEGRVFSGARFFQHAQMIDGDLGFLQLLDEYRQVQGYSPEQQFRLQFYPAVRPDLREALRSGIQPGAAFAGSKALLALAGLLGLGRSAVSGPGALASPLSTMDAADELLSLAGSSPEAPLCYAPAAAALRRL